MDGGIDGMGMWDIGGLDWWDTGGMTGNGRRMRMLKYFVDNYPQKTCRMV